MKQGEDPKEVLKAAVGNIFDGKGKMLWETHLSNSDFPVNSVNVSSDGKFIVAGTNYSHLYLHDIKGNILSTFW